jgi:hypothetical protein
VKPERVLLPLLAVALAVFGTSRLMESIDPGQVRASGLSEQTLERLDRERKRRVRQGERRGKREKRRASELHSLLSPAGMRELKTLIRREAKRGDVTLFRVTANDAQVHVARPTGGGMLLVLERGPSVRFRTPTPVGIPGGFPLGDIDVYAPRRVGAGIARLSRATLADVDYMVYLVNPVTREGQWNAFLGDPAHTHFQADAHGRGVTSP